MVMRMYCILDLLRVNQGVVNAQADSVIDGVGDGGGGEDAANLAHALSAVRPLGGGVFDYDGDDIRHDVETMIVNGQMVVEDGKLRTADEEELIALADEKGRALMKRAVEHDPELSWLWKR